MSGSEVAATVRAQQPERNISVVEDTADQLCEPACPRKVREPALGHTTAAQDREPRISLRADRESGHPPRDGSHLSGGQNE
jgi:hypothetical protein